MSIFGALDAAKIPTNPFYIEAGVYEAEVTNAFYKNNKDDEKQLVIEYTITDEESSFLDSKTSQYFTLVPENMTEKDVAMLPAEDQRKLRRTLSALKKTLCGNENNPRMKGLGVPIEDLDEDWQPETLIGTKIVLQISNYGPTNEGVNIKSVNLREE